MLKKYIRTIFASLVAMGAIFFVGSAYSNGNSVVAGQPQLDMPAAGSAPFQQSVQMNAGSSGATKETPTSANSQAVEREIFKGEVVTNK
jgi:type IV secretory pathway TrbL component